MKQDESIIKVSIESLIPSTYQPRKLFDAGSLNELAASIKEYGILNPILVRKVNDKYEIIAGERRVRAAKLCGLTEVPVIIKNVDEKKLASISLTENIQREDINPIEEAKSYKKILEETKTTEAQLSKTIGKSQSFISNKIRLLSLPEEVIDAIAKKKISERHGRTLLSVKDKNKQIELLNRIINERLNIKELENIINEKRITELEIQDAITDILKNLQIDEENQKEEKESDNMNNESFFPNFNGGPVQNNSQATLNSMNIQAMTPTQPPLPAAPIEEPVQPVAPSPIPEFGVNAPVEPIAPQVMPEPVTAPVEPVLPTAAPAPLPAAPILEPASPIPEPVLPVLENASPAIPMNQAPVEAPVSMPAGETPLFDPNLTPPVTNDAVNNIPLFTEQNNSVAAPVEPIAPQVMPEPAPMPTNPPVEPVTAPVPAPIETPTETPTEVPVIDKLGTVEEFLKTNNIEYKLYSNETNHCIIIEI